MAKRLMALLGVLALMLATAVPALAESEPQLTGVIERPEMTTYQYGTHALTDESGHFYALESEVADLDVYVGQRVTVYGSFVPGYEDGQVEGGPPLFEVTRVESAGPGVTPPGPVPGTSATFTFELAVECEPPAGAEFLGLTATESLVTTPLTDPDGDGVYTGSQTVPRFAPGGPQQPITISPVRIVQGPPTGVSALGPEYRIIEDFGAVLAEDQTFSASVSFCDGGGNNGGGDGGNGVSVVSGDTNNVGNGGAVVQPDDGTNVLPATGGVALAAAAGALLIAGGLIARRLYR